MSALDARLARQWETLSLLDVERIAQSAAESVAPSASAHRSEAAIAALSVGTRADGFGYALNDASTARRHGTAMIVHPLFPQGAAHFVHPCEHLRASREVRIPGLPFAFRIPQRQRAAGDAGDDTGQGVWRGATVLGRRLLATRCEGRVDGAAARGAARPVAVELGCGVGAVTASVAAFLGCDAHGTDYPAIVADAAGIVADNARRAGGFRGTVGVAPLAWGGAGAAAFAERFLPPRKADLVLGSEVVYALANTAVADALVVFEALAETIAALLADDGVCLIAYCSRCDVERHFFDALPRHGLALRADNLGPSDGASRAGIYGGRGVPRGVPVADLGLRPHEVEGMRLFAIEKARGGG
jgi:hypothetical protein